MTDPQASPPSPAQPDETVKNQIIGQLYSTGYFDASTPDRYDEVALTADNILGMVRARLIDEIEAEMPLEMTEKPLPDHMIGAEEAFTIAARTGTREGWNAYQAEVSAILERKRRAL